MHVKCIITHRPKFIPNSLDELPGQLVSETGEADNPVHEAAAGPRSDRRLHDTEVRVHVEVSVRQSQHSAQRKSHAHARAPRVWVL